MKVLIYCSMLNLGGGVRLLSRLASAIAQHSSVEQLTVLIEDGSAHTKYLQTLDTPKMHVQIIPSVAIEKVIGRDFSVKGVSAVQSYAQRHMLPSLLDRRREKLLRQTMQAYDIMYAFWPQKQRYYDVGKPVICTYQDTTFLDFPEILGGKQAAKEIENAKSWVENAHLVVSSNAVREKLVHHFGVVASGADIIYHNILPEAPNWNESDDAVMREELGLPPRYFLYPANINAHKNHDTLLKAWSRFEERMQVPLILIGEGVEVLDSNWSLSRNTYWRQDYLYGLARRLGLKLGQEVLALGYVTNEALGAVTRGATALIMPSYAEGGGSYPVEEALAYGIPVVCSDIPVMREHLAARSARVGWFDPYSSEAILQAIRHLFQNYDQYKQSAMQAKTDVRPTWDEIASQYVRLFKVLSKAGA
jgi:glycosyltransferase involved in cell wall biosynthesis